MSYTLYHNPRCSKSRQTLELLESRGIEPRVVRYLETPPSVTELQQLLGQLGFVSARDLMRTKEDLYSELGLGDTTLSEQSLLEAMVQNPKLIERPIVVLGERAVLGRPPENVLALIQES